MWLLALCLLLCATPLAAFDDECIEFQLGPPTSPVAGLPLDIEVAGSTGVASPRSPARTAADTEPAPPLRPNAPLEVATLSFGGDSCVSHIRWFPSSNGEL